jgi:hypothetical protein
MFLEPDEQTRHVNRVVKFVWVHPFFLKVCNPMDKVTILAKLIIIILLNIIYFPIIRQSF